MEMQKQEEEMEKQEVYRTHLPYEAIHSLSTRLVPRLPCQFNILLLNSNSQIDTEDGAWGFPFVRRGLLSSVFLFPLRGVAWSTFGDVPFLGDVSSLRRGVSFAPSVVSPCFPSAMCGVYNLGSLRRCLLVSLRRCAASLFPFGGVRRLPFIFVPCMAF